MARTAISSRNNDGSPEHSFIAGIILQGTLLWSIGESYLHFREQRRVADRIGQCLGKELSNDEVTRLTAAAYRYRAMARLDRSYPQWMNFVEDDIIERDFQGRAGFLLISLSTLFRRATLRWAQEIGGANLTELRGNASNDRALAFLPATGDRGSDAPERVREVLNLAAARRVPVYGIHVVRSSLTGYRCLVPRLLFERGEEVHREELDDAQRKVCQFVDDCLRENPAQYDWFDGS